jgi:prepilin-type processing-associated H-X9-DG protein
MTLIELMTLVLVVAVVMAIAVAFMQSNRTTCTRTAHCANNMRNIGLALVNYQTSHKCFPAAGTFYEDPADHRGDPLRSNIYRAITEPGTRPEAADTWLRSWVVEILPYLDAQDMYNAWDSRESYLSPVPSAPSVLPNVNIAATSIGILRCPDDPTSVPGQGNLSYVVNGGFARWHAIPIGWSGSNVDGKAGNGHVLQWGPAGATWQDSQALGQKLGVMFLGTHTGDRPWDIRTTAADVADGLAQTLLVGENTLVGYSPGTAYSGGRETNWACPLPNFTMFLGSDDVCRSDHSTTDCLGGQLRPGPGGETGNGWGRANQVGTFEDINFGQRLTVKGSFPFANSAYPGRANFVFCDGSVRALSPTIDGTVYARLITPAGTLLPSHLRQAQVSPDEIDP